MAQSEALSAALRALSLRWDERYEILSVPDEIERQAPAVDLLVRGKHGEMVIEHTIVESFSKRIFDDHLFALLATELERLLFNELPMPGDYRVVFPPGQLQHEHTLSVIAQEAAAWAKKVAPSLELGDPMTSPAHIAEGVLPSSGVHVRLERWPGRDGQVLAYRSIPGDFVERRRERIGAALDKKLPKLAAAAASKRRSLLVLESDDLALGSYGDIAAATVYELVQRTDVPDVICLVETELGADVWLIKEFSELFPDLSSPLLG